MNKQFQIRGDPDDKLSQAINLIVEMLNDGKEEWQNIKNEMGRIGANIDFAFGYDTQGLFDFADTGFRNPLTLFNGFFIDETPQVMEDDTIDAEPMGEGDPAADEGGEGWPDARLELSFPGGFNDYTIVSGSVLVRAERLELLIQGFTMRQIAERLGIKQASIYYYFDSKEEALAEVCLYGISDYVSRMEAIAAKDLALDAKLLAVVNFGGKAGFIVPETEEVLLPHLPAGRATRLWRDYWPAPWYRQPAKVAVGQDLCPWPH